MCNEDILVRCDGEAVIEYEKMSDVELYSFLKEKVPAVAETVRKVGESNRETLIAFLRFLSNEPG